MLLVGAIGDKVWKPLQIAISSVTLEPAIDPTVEPKAGTVPYLHLFRFANALDVAVLMVGGVFAIAAGATQPLFAVLFGQLIDAFGGNQGEVRSRP